MADPKPIVQEIAIGFSMVDSDGTAPLRSVAEHAARVGTAWATLADELSKLADAFEVLTGVGTGAGEGTSPT